MNQYNWQYLNKQISYFLEYNILPNLISYSINLLYYSNRIRGINYYTLYNNVKSYINIVNDDYRLVNIIVINILKNKYKLQIISFYPLKIKRID
jgi:hypothetical protein